MVGMVGLIQTQQAKATDEVTVVRKVSICHRDNNVDQPYGPKKITVSVRSIFKEKGHDSHDGPVATSAVVAQELKDAHTKWGDIIPAFYYRDGETIKHYDGKNLETGSAILNNDCQYPADVEEQANVNVTLSCDTARNVFTVSFANSGDGSASVYFNGETFVLAGGQTTTRTLAAGQSLTVKVDGAVYQSTGGEKYENKVLASCQGNGSVVTTTNTPPAGGGQGSASGVASLPYTGSAASAVTAVVAIVGTIVSAIGGYLLQRRSAFNL